MERDLIGWSWQDWLPHVEDDIRTGVFEMTFTISIEKGAERKAITCLNCLSEAHAIYDVETEYPDWIIVTIKEGW